MPAPEAGSACVPCVLAARRTVASSAESLPSGAVWLRHRVGHGGRTDRGRCGRDARARHRCGRPPLPAGLGAAARLVVEHRRRRTDGLGDHGLRRLDPGPVVVVTAAAGRRALGLADERRVTLLVEDDDRRAAQPLLLLDRLQRPGELERRRRSVRGVLGHRLGQQALETGRHVLATRRGRRGAPDPRHQRIRRVVTARDLERRTADEQLPQRRGERVDVGALVAVALAVEHLRRGPRHRDADVVGGLGRGVALAGAATGDAEVGQARGAVGADEDVGRLDVAVRDVGAVRRLDGTRELDAGAQDVLDGEALGPGPHRQVGRRVVLHDEVGPAVVGRTGTEDLHDVRVVAQGGHGVGLLDELLAQRVGQALGLEHLDRDRHAGALLLVEEDVGVTAGAERLDEDEARDLRGRTLLHEAPPSAAGRWSGVRVTTPPRR